MGSLYSYFLRYIEDGAAPHHCKISIFLSNRLFVKEKFLIFVKKSIGSMGRFLIAFSLFCSMLAGCGGGGIHRERDLSELKSHLQDGDLLFRLGTGYAGRVVSSLDRVGNYSHVGIVVDVDGEWRVVHAVPYEPEFKGDIDRVKCEELESFLGRYSNSDFGLYRVQIEAHKKSGVVRHALRLSEKMVPFDHDYNLEDTTQLYCTELVEYLYSLVGYSLSEGRRTEVTFPSLSGSYIFPSDLTQSSILKPIY